MKFICGDEIQQGSYPIHSRFKRAANYLSADGKLLSIVLNEKAAGPLNLVLLKKSSSYTPLHTNAPSIENIDSVVVYDRSCNSPYRLQLLLLQGKASWYILKTEVSTYQSEIALPAQQTYRWQERLHDSCTKLKAAILTQAPGDSLRFLLNTKITSSANASTFEMHLQRHLSEAKERILERADITALAAFRGVGIGLTPAGDDFILGFILAIKIFQYIYLHRHKQLTAYFELGKLCEEIDHIVSKNRQEETDDPLFRNHFHALKAGKIGYQSKQLIASLFTADAEEIQKSVTLLLQIGHSSGIDFGVGLLHGVEFLNKRRE
ncbi:MAG: DUF2877 domain-containing protein [Oligoflexia bacterium]|nr:DUF2877 domain-containing protein [Oligoflexia bacterium]